MKKEVKGKLLLLGNNIDTDLIYPGRFLELTDAKQIGSHCLSGIDAQIAPNFPSGGIIVAGTNFGCGSSREHAAIALVNMGTSLVIADSFARIFYRNGINLGLPLLVCKGLSQHVINGQTLVVNLEKGVVCVKETGEQYAAEALSDKAIEILTYGGIKQYMISKRFKD